MNEPIPFAGYVDIGEDMPNKLVEEAPYHPGYEDASFDPVIRKELSQEQCFLLAVKIVKDRLIPWPDNADSKLWNERLNSLLSDLCLKFGYDGEND